MKSNGITRTVFVVGIAALIGGLLPAQSSHAQIDGGSLNPNDVAKYADPLIIPPAMPRTDVISGKKGQKKTDYYEIAVRQFQQQILPSDLPATTVWSYGSLAAQGTVAEGGSFNYPAFTIEAKHQQPVRVKWINDLVDANGNFLPHLLPVDQTLHWANPVGNCMDGTTGTDCRGTNPAPYTGPVPMISHVHGADTYEWSDGYPEAWYLPAANNIPDEIQFTSGSFYDTFLNESPLGGDWEPGSAVFEYPNDMKATTLWYHDHSLGMTRVNVYAGPAGFWLLRGGPGDAVLTTKGKAAVLPGPAPALGDAPGMDYYEIPIVIQDRSFNDDGSLFYPDNRAFFEGIEPEQLQIPFIPDNADNGEPSDIAPIWNPEFFGNMMVVNGRTWPYLEVEQRRYRFRYLNGSDSRFLILATDQAGLQFHQIGADGGFLAAVASQDQLLLGPAERADVIMDFGAYPEGTVITLLNLGPDEPFGGGVPDDDFDIADPGSTGQVMQFRVVKRKGADKSTQVADLVLPAVVPYGDPDNVRRLSLNEGMSHSVFVTDENGNIVQLLETEGGEAFGPAEALLGTVDELGSPVGMKWGGVTTENPVAGATEVWEIYNFTADAHPIHIHLVQFQVIDREGLVFDGEDVALPVTPDGTSRLPEVWESGYKDTVIAYPGEVTRVKASFDREGLFVWHCHILEHEDNEMMRPYCVGNPNAGACGQHNGATE
jgi:FtsP/CotA-like multicopper oxidase with cupredoxin domain